MQISRQAMSSAMTPESRNRGPPRLLSCRTPPCHTFIRLRHSAVRRARGGVGTGENTRKSNRDGGASHADSQRMLTQRSINLDPGYAPNHIMIILVQQHQTFVTRRHAVMRGGRGDGRERLAPRAWAWCAGVTDLRSMPASSSNWTSFRGSRIDALLAHGLR
jgi:hypothetical protein